MSNDLLLLNHRIANPINVDINSNSDLGNLGKAVEKVKGNEKPSLNDYIDDKNSKKTKKSSIGDSFTLNSEQKNESNYNKLSDIEKYRYILSQSQKIDITNAINQPEETLKEAEKIISRTLKQGLTDGDKANLQKALQAKQIAKQRLDMLG